MVCKYEQVKKHVNKLWMVCHEQWLKKITGSGVHWLFVSTHFMPSHRKTMEKKDEHIAVPVPEQFTRLWRKIVTISLALYNIKKFSKIILFENKNTQPTWEICGVSSLFVSRMLPETGPVFEMLLVFVCCTCPEMGFGSWFLYARDAASSPQLKHNGR